MAFTPLIIPDNTGIINIDSNIGLENVKDNSIAVIFTDPPYIKDEWYNAYSLLSKHSYRILKESGFLVVYCPQERIPAVINIFLNIGLSYYWSIIQVNTGPSNVIHSKNIIAGYKLILIFQKPPFKKIEKTICDMIYGRRSKKYHPWEQSIHDVIHILSRIAKGDDIILDPFMGSGTTILGCKLLGLCGIGYEIDPKTYEIAKRRLEQKSIIDLYNFVAE